MGNTVNDRELILEILLAVTRDGEYSHIALRNVLENYQRIKLVNPESYKDIEKGYDGLFRLRDGTSLAQDQTVKVRSGMLEGSNVNPVEELTSLIRIQRQYDTTVKLIDEAGQMDQAQDRLLSYQ